MSVKSVSTDVYSYSVHPIIFAYMLTCTDLLQFREPNHHRVEEARYQGRCDGEYMKK